MWSIKINKLEFFLFIAWIRELFAYLHVPYIRQAETKHFSKFVSMSIGNPRGRFFVNFSRENRVYRFR